MVGSDHIQRKLQLFTWQLHDSKNPAFEHSWKLFNMLTRVPTKQDDKVCGKPSILWSFKYIQESVIKISSWWRFPKGHLSHSEIKEMYSWRENIFFGYSCWNIWNIIELLNTQIQSYNFQDPQEFLENIPSPKQEEIVLPLDLHSENDCSFKYQNEYVSSNFNIENTTTPLVIEGLEENIIHHDFIDPMAEYMEVLLNSNSQACTVYKAQIHHQLPFHIINLVMRTHNQVTLMLFLTDSQVLHFFFQLLDWLHSHFCITWFSIIFRSIG